MSASSAGALAEHLRYISRHSAMEDKDQGKLFNAVENDVDREQFQERAQSDRHHFRFIVSPEDGGAMEDLKPFVRDLVAGMEADLGTRLDWAGAIHHDTEHPHAHLVVRGRRSDGSDLVMPRAYIAHGIRERASNLITLELGPETRLEQDKKIAGEIRHERLTRIDRGLMNLAGDDRVLNVNDSPPRYRQINVARLRVLESMDLAENVSGHRWKLSADLREKLTELGQRGDVIKSLHRAMGERSDRRIDSDGVFLDNGKTAAPVMGAIVRTGVEGPFHDQAYAILDTMDGRLIRTAVSDEIGLKPGMIISLTAPVAEPRASDRTIAGIAAANGGRYSAALHQASDPRARDTFVDAHIRRLEAMRRAGHARRFKDGSWAVPGDYLSRAAEFEAQRGPGRGARIHVESYLSLSDQVHDTGETWLDRRDVGSGVSAGFGHDVDQAKAARQSVLVERGVLARADARLTTQQLRSLRDAGMEQAAASIAASLGKTHQPLPQSGWVEGKFNRTVDAGHGRYAVLEKNKAFTLAPWRSVLERVRGQVISGQVKAGRVNWSLGRGRGKGLSR